MRHARTLSLLPVAMLQSLIPNPIRQFWILRKTLGYFGVSVLPTKVSQFFVHGVPLHFLWIPFETNRFENFDAFWCDFGLAFLLEYPVFDCGLLRIQDE